MVFTTTNLFKGIACPEGEQCRLTNCIFSHELRPKRGESKPAAETLDTSGEPAAKRRKVSAQAQPGWPLSKSDQIREQLAAEREGLPEKHSLSPGLPPSLSKPVTPPPTNGNRSTNLTSRESNGTSEINRFAAIESKASDSGPTESLNPRRIPSDPVGHSKRTLYLKHMHGELVRLDKRVSDAKNLPNNKLLHLSEQELIKMALDEEEHLARTQSSLYTNKVKQRVAALKKMDMEGWISHVKVTIIEPRNKSTTKKADPDEKIINTGLTSDEEVLILPHLIADQSTLAPHGYIPAPPTAAEADAARASVEASKNFEVCDRCSSRFQVFPTRNEDGLLTSNGPCKFHPLKKAFPQKTRSDYNAAAKEPYYPCCSNLVGSVGCTTHENHVFKTSSPARLAAVLPFISTPENDNPKPDRQGREVKAVAFDCEMGYTTCGMELIRLTAVTWPRGDELVDVLVRPIGTIIDLNSRFSGVFPEHFTNAIAYSDYTTASPAPPSSPSNDQPTRLPIVSSPAHARQLLLAHITPRTPLIGHALDNDLNTTRLCHPAIIDTVLLFRHPRGLPYRFGLKMLVLQHLGKRIQQGGERGHDSSEDARGAGELVRVRVGEKWAQLKARGFVIESGVLGKRDGSGTFSPLGQGNEGAGEAGRPGGGGKKKNTRGTRGGKAEKAKRSAAYGMDGAADEEDGEEEGGGKPAAGNGLAAFLERAQAERR